MSEEILKALMELFAIIVRHSWGILKSERDYVEDFLRTQLSSESFAGYLSLFDKHAGPVRESAAQTRFTPPSARDSVKILAICRNINLTLNDEQRVVVVMRLYELLSADRQFTPHRMDIITTVAEVFRIAPGEIRSMELFIKTVDTTEISDPAILVFNPGGEKCETCGTLPDGSRNTIVLILRIASVDLYFFRYRSDEQLYLNGLRVFAGKIYTFPKGGSVKTQHGNAIYYSDITSTFLSDKIVNRLSFTAENLSCFFSEGDAAIDNISFSVEEGKLVGILGASGSGKTTLLNLISGIHKPDSGSVTINGVNIHDRSSSLDGVFGYVPQDDLLIEDLTVFENLYYAACQSVGNKHEKELVALVDQTLLNLGILEKRDLKVGSPLNKVISGGQRKRLNIALELIREPSVLFLDEPTSGLASRDSEILMDLLRNLTLKGKLIFTVIHQPSSEIFKMFDKVLILDQKGYLAYSGNPVDAVIYFKTLDSRVNATQGECPSCGNVNPETIFNIIETQVVDEFGKYTEKRKIRPEEWAERFRKRHPFAKVPEITDPPPKNLHRPGLFRQFMIYLSRDFRSKISNRQYVLLTLLEAPVLGVLLSFVIRYIPDPGSDIYIFAENENIPIYIFMSLIVALFLGLTLSAEEIFRDRKILKREHFLNLSRNSYLLSKISLLIVISAIQSLLFVIVANPVLGIKGMLMNYWLALFTTAFCANMVGLNISAAFNSAITIYIIIPLLIIPMMILSGAMFPFDKLNRKIASVGKVPVIAEIMPTRWTYEALMVSQFKDNRYSKVEYNESGETFYELKKKISEADFNKVYRIPELIKALEISSAEINFDLGRGSTRESDPDNSPAGRYSKLDLIRNELSLMSEFYSIQKFRYADDLTPENFNHDIADSLRSYLSRQTRLFNQRSNSASDMLDGFFNANQVKLKELEKDYYNYKLEEIITKYYEPDKVLIYKNSIVQNTDPVYLDPSSTGYFNFRTHFFAPSKYISGKKYDTFRFNICVVLLSTILLYLTLYYEIPGKIIRIGDKFKPIK